MKKLLIFLILFSLSASLAFSSPETWLSFGYEFGFLADQYKFNGAASETMIISDGLNISAHSFLTDRIGIFTHGNFSFPRDIWTITGTGLRQLDLDNSPYNYTIGLIMGIAFRIDFSDDFKSYFGLGINFVSSSAMYNIPSSGILVSNSYHTIDTFSIGFAGDMGIKLDMSDRFFLRVGTIISVDFSRHRDRQNFSGRSMVSEASDWDMEFVMLGLRPYIGVGLNLYYVRENGRFRMLTGKP